MPCSSAPVHIHASSVSHLTSQALITMQFHSMNIFNLNHKNLHFIWFYSVNMDIKDITLHTCHCFTKCISFVGGFTILTWNCTEFTPWYHKLNGTHLLWTADEEIPYFYRTQWVTAVLWKLTARPHPWSFESNVYYTSYRLPWWCGG
jgi:hypothetical protein